jgi:hypothetical protein
MRLRQTPRWNTALTVYSSHMLAKKINSGRRRSVFALSRENTTSVNVATATAAAA